MNSSSPRQDQETFNPFPEDRYDTPEKTQGSFFNLFGIRFSFYLRNFYVFARAGLQANHTAFPPSVQISNSKKNFSIIESCGGKIHLRGLLNLDKAEGPVVFIGNHMSLLETALMHAFMRPHKDFCFVIKESLLHVPFFGNIMRKLGCIAVGRANPREDFKVVLEEGTEQIRRGRSVVIFPQSHRTAVFDRTHFNTIGVKLAKHANVPIIPFALRTDFLENGKWIKDLGPVDKNKPVWFEFGEPILVHGNGKEEQQKIIEFIESRLTSWGCRIAGDASSQIQEQKEVTKN